MVQLPSPGRSPRKFELTVDRTGSVYAAYEWQKDNVRGVRVCKASPGGFFGGFGTHVWSEEMEIEGGELVGIGMIGENEVGVLGSNGLGVVFDSDGQRVGEIVSMYRGQEISAMEIWEHRAWFVLPVIGEIWVVEITEFAGKFYGGDWPSVRMIGGGVGQDGQMVRPVNIARADEDRLFVVNGGMGRIEV